MAISTPEQVRMYVRSVTTQIISDNDLLKYMNDSDEELLAILSKQYDTSTIMNNNLLKLIAAKKSALQVVLSLYESNPSNDLIPNIERLRSEVDDYIFRLKIGELRL
jgi:hypothetical protein